jgi:predicted ATP-grasp superfamily ATP-dependent carboligase
MWSLIVDSILVVGGSMIGTYVSVHDLEKDIEQMHEQLREVRTQLEHHESMTIGSIKGFPCP